MQTSDYLEQLIQDRDDLVDNLTTQGITGLTGDETFTELVPEVLNIETGADLNDYFQSSISNANNSTYAGWKLAIKKFPPMNYNGTTTSYMYGNCFMITYDFSLHDFSNTTNMSYMFDTAGRDNNGIEVDFKSHDLSKVQSMTGMFNHAFLKTVDFQNCNLEKLVDVRNMFPSQSNEIAEFTNLVWGINYGKGFTATQTNYNNYILSLSGATSLTHDSLMSVINNLYDLNLTYNVAGGGTLYRQSLVLGATNLAKLSSAEIQIATNKGWNVS